MYLSQVALNARDTYDQHQAIWSLFPGTPDRQRDHLFRIEQSNPSRSIALLQSSTAPQSSQQAKVIVSKTFTPHVSENSFYKFKIVAYPTRRFSQSRKVVEIQNPDEQVEWLQRKLSGANVTVAALDCFLVSSKKSFNSRFVCFEGVLQIIEKEPIERALIMGIGRKKHAGAGLLSLARTA